MLLLGALLPLGSGDSVIPRNQFAVGFLGADQWAEPFPVSILV